MLKSYQEYDAMTREQLLTEVSVMRVEIYSLRKRLEAAVGFHEMDIRAQQDASNH